jgi:hypothetical protein
MIVPNAPIPLAADSKLDLAASTALGKVEGGNGRGLFGQSAVVIAPSLEGGSSVQGLPDLADTLQSHYLPISPDQLAGALDYFHGRSL